MTLLINNDAHLRVISACQLPTTTAARWKNINKADRAMMDSNFARFWIYMYSLSVHVNSRPPSKRLIHIFFTICMHEWLQLNIIKENVSKENEQEIISVHLFTQKFLHIVLPIFCFQLSWYKMLTFWKHLSQYILKAAYYILVLGTEGHEK